MEDNVPSGGGVLYIDSVDEMILVESPVAVEIDPNNSAVVVETTQLFAWILTGIGCTALADTTYWLKIGTTEGTHTNEPLGLFNNPMRLSPGIIVGAGVAVQYHAAVALGAPAPQSYVGKIIGYKK